MKKCIGYAVTGSLYDEAVWKVFGRCASEVSVIPYRNCHYWILYNNPEKDTAADIVERRMLPKGNVSAGVETLVQKELLIRRQDQADRRKIHLSLLEKAFPIIREIDEINQNFREQIFKKFFRRRIEKLWSYEWTALKKIWKRF